MRYRTRLTSLFRKRFILGHPPHFGFEGNKREFGVTLFTSEHPLRVRDIYSLLCKRLFKYRISRRIPVWLGNPASPLKNHAILRERIRGPITYDRLPDFYYVYLRWDRLTSFGTLVWTNIFDIRRTYLNRYRPWELARFGKLRNFPLRFSQPLHLHRQDQVIVRRHVTNVLFECGNVRYFTFHRDSLLRITLSFQILPPLYILNIAKRNMYHSHD